MVLIGAALACAPAQEKANGDTLAAIDTLKPATAVAAPDSTALKTASRSDSTKRVSAPSVGGPRTTKRRDSIIGRDSVIPLDNKKPKLDTVVKKPPQ